MRLLALYAVFAVLLASCATLETTSQPLPQPAQQNTSLVTASFPVETALEADAPLPEPLPIEETEVVEEVMDIIVDEAQETTELVTPEIDEIIISEDPLEQSFTIMLKEQHDVEQANDPEAAPPEELMEEDTDEITETLLWGDPDKKKPSLVMEEDGSLKFDFGKDTRWHADIGYDHGPEAWLIYKLEWDFNKPRRK